MFTVSTDRDGEYEKSVTNAHEDGSPSGPDSLSQAPGRWEALDMLTRSAAMELGLHGVRAVSTVPGAIATGHHGIATSDQPMANSPVGPDRVAAEHRRTRRLPSLRPRQLHHRRAHRQRRGSGAACYHQYDRLRGHVAEEP